MERILCYGNDAVGWGAVFAGCEAFFGYPITPQNEITEWFAREYPKRGKVFLQTQSEIGTISMIYGAAATGIRVMSSTSSPGWSLMLEGISHLVNAELPCVIVDVQRGGPGMGTTQHSQMDYTSVTKGGGHGGYKHIVLAPSTAQQNGDYVQSAFYLADKYRNPVIMISDSIVGQMMEPFEMKALDFDPLPEKGWALTGKENRANGERNMVQCGQGLFFEPPHIPNYGALLAHLDNKFKEMEKSEVKFESYFIDDAELILVAYGYTARVSREAINDARNEGLKVGLIQPITLWPFPSQIIREKAGEGVKFLVVEDSLGQLVEDVKVAIAERTEVFFVGALSRHNPTPGGFILPHIVLEKIKEIV